VALAIAGCVGIPEAERKRLAAIEADWTRPVTLDAGRPLPLRDLQEAAIRRNAGLTALFFRYKAALESIVLQGAFDDPQVRFGYFVESIETRAGPQNWRAGVSQRFPFYGKRKLRAEVALHEAHGLREMLVEQRLKIAWDTARAYWDVYALDRAAAVTREQVTLLKRLHRSAEARFRSGRAPKADLVAISMESDDLKTELANLARRRREAVARLNALLDRAPDTPLRLRFPAPGGKEAPAMPALDEPSLVAAAREFGPVRVGAHNILRQEAALALAKLGYFPDVTVGYDYISTGSASGGGSDSGKDAQILGVGFNLPIWFRKNRARVERARNLLEAERASRRHLVREAERAAVDAVRAAGEAEALRALFDARLLPQAEERLQLSERDYVGGRVDLDRLIAAEKDLLRFRLRRARALAARESALARLDHLTAGAVGRLPRARPAGAEDIPEVDALNSAKKPNGTRRGHAPR
jgi:outer membrane protein TolC